MTATSTTTASIKVPRASLSVTILRDPDYVELALTPDGRQALLLFVMLILAAKDQNNGGRFKASRPVLAMLVRWPLEAFNAALETLLKSPSRWVFEDNGEIILRSFARWNPAWGGQRDGAGRPSQDSSVIQVDSSRIQDVPNSVASVSVSASVTSKDTTLAAGAADVPKPSKPKAKTPFTYPANFEKCWGFWPRKVSKGAALKAWNRISADDQDAALDKAEEVGGCWAANDPHKQRIQFCQHLATWLNARGWESPIEETELMARGR